MTTPVSLVKQANPSFFCLHPKLDVLYCVTETMRTDPQSPATVVSYRVTHASTASPIRLDRLNAQKVDGDIPCHVSVDDKGECLVVANYTSGSVVTYPLASDGSILAASSNIQHPTATTSTGKTKSPRGHCSVWDPSNRFVMVADLGLDQVFVYEYDRVQKKISADKRTTLTLAPGAGPRHIAIHPNGKWVYVINELNLTMTAANWDSQKGILTEINSASTVPAGVNTQGFSTAEVIVHPNGKFVYGSNRGHDSIARFSIDSATGKIAPLGQTPTGGKTPRNFRISPDGKWMLVENQQSDTVFSFRIDEQTGDLTQSGHSIALKAPACIKFIAAKPLQ
jgi:6-phosphogluconolactonase